jgi:hypothetical protein
MLSVYGKVRFVVNKDMINTRGEGTPLAKKITISGRACPQKPKISITACFSALKKVQNR